MHGDSRRLHLLCARHLPSNICPGLYFGCREVRPKLGRGYNPPQNSGSWLPCSHWEPSEFRTVLSSPCSFCQNPASLPVRGQVTPSPCALLCPPQSLPVAESYSFTSSRSRPLQPRVTFRKPFLPREPRQMAKAVQPLFMCPKLEGGACPGTSTWQEGMWSRAVDWGRFPSQTLSALGVWEGNEEGRGLGGGAAKGVQADKAVTKASCKSSTKDL